MGPNSTTAPFSGGIQFEGVAGSAAPLPPFPKATGMRPRPLPVPAPPCTGSGPGDLQRRPWIGRQPLRSDHRPRVGPVPVVLLQGPARGVAPAAGGRPVKQRLGCPYRPLERASFRGGGLEGGGCALPALGPAARTGALRRPHTVHQAFLHRSCTGPPKRGTDHRRASDAVHPLLKTVTAPTARHSTGAPRSATSSAKKGPVKPLYHRMPFPIPALFIRVLASVLHRSEGHFPCRGIARAGLPVYRFIGHEILAY